MSANIAIALIYSPTAIWKRISDKQQTVAQIYYKFLIFFAAIPPASAFVGAAYTGWTIGDTTYRMTVESALQLSIAAYFAILVAVAVIAGFVHWMAKTYGTKPRYRRCLKLTAYSLTPMFVAGILGTFPILWLDMLITLVAIGLSVNLLYKGTPEVMGINQEKGFLFASSILTVCLVCFVGMIAITIVFWGSGLNPVFAA